ncbi:CapA family protein [Chungangia koreensis]|uniref:CapA family protein n=1 Tax=Chungangia koreensis TaxID=752657 RepID=A0ABV8X5L6_9LACT
MKAQVSLFIGLLTISFMILGSIRVSETRTVADFEALKSSEFQAIEVSADRVTIGMIGDVLLHYPLYIYENFENSFLGVFSKMDSFDFLMANVESLPGGVELGLSGYPQFNSPAHIVRDLGASGVDLVSMANNHSFDKGEDGLLRAIGNVEEYGMPYVGVAKSVEDAEQLRIVDVDGVRVGVLAYTYGMNGFALPVGKDYLVSLIDEEKMISDVGRIRSACDLVAMSIHWGSEYMLEPSEGQKELAQKMADAGVDVIFGHHPHVLQPYEVVEAVDGRQTHVFYSLGNFFSAQPFEYTNVGGIGSVEVERIGVSGKGYVKVVGADFFPTAVVKKDGILQVVPLEEGTAAVGKTSEWAVAHVGAE